MLKTKSSAQVRAATAQVQKRKQILVSSIAVCDYIGNLSFKEERRARRHVMSLGMQNVEREREIAIG